MVASGNVSCQNLLNWASSRSEAIVSTVRHDNFWASAADMFGVCKVPFKISLWLSTKWPKRIPKKKSKLFICVLIPITLAFISGSLYSDKHQPHRFFSFLENVKILYRLFARTDHLDWLKLLIGLFANSVAISSPINSFKCDSYLEENLTRFVISKAAFNEFFINVQFLMVLLQARLREWQKQWTTKPRWLIFCLMILATSETLPIIALHPS